MRRALVSWGTILTGLLSVVAWSLPWGWRAGVALTLLLYVHEVGHTLAALRRGVPVLRAPLFLPGLGAVAPLGPLVAVGDTVVVALAGPLLGGAAALLVKLAATALGQDELARAGDVALLINVVNLALPLSPLDGGRILARAGWLGFLPAVPLALLLVLALPGPFSVALALAGLYIAYRAARRDGGAPTRGRLAIFGIYVVAVVALGGAYLASGPLPFAAPAWPAGLPAFAIVQRWALEWGAVVLVLDALAWWTIARPGSGRGRYVAMALLGWPRLLLGAPWRIPLAACLAARLVGLPGLRWLEALVRYHAQRGALVAGDAIAMGYDGLRRSGDAGADAWLARQVPRAAPAPAICERAYELLVGCGWDREANRWLVATLGDAEPVALTPFIANNVAYALLLAGRLEDALPLATASDAAVPGDGCTLGTLGEIHLALGDPALAEELLRRALAAREISINRLALARALAAQRRYEEACVEAERVLTTHPGPWLAAWGGASATGQPQRAIAPRAITTP